MNMNTYAFPWPGFKPALFIVLLTLILPYAITFIALLGSTNTLRWKLPVIISSLALPIAILLLTQLSCVKIQIDSNQLTVGGGLYKETVKLSDIDRNAVRVVNLAETRRLIGTRVNGVGLPGFSLGWFQPCHGKKLFVLVSEQKSVFVPTTKEYDFLISSPDADQLKSDLSNLDEENSIRMRKA